MNKEEMLEHLLHGTLLINDNFYTLDRDLISIESLGITDPKTLEVINETTGANTIMAVNVLTSTWKIFSMDSIKSVQKL